MGSDEAEELAGERLSAGWFPHEVAHRYIRRVVSVWADGVFKRTEPKLALWTI